MKKLLMIALFSLALVNFMPKGVEAEHCGDFEDSGIRNACIQNHQDFVDAQIGADAARRAACDTHFLGIPAWHNGLSKTSPPDCDVVIRGFSAITTVLLNVIQMGLRAAALVALIMVMVSGIRYITSSGSPDAVKSASKTLTYALGGLAIALLATTIISVILGRF